MAIDFQPTDQDQSKIDFQPTEQSKVDERAGQFNPQLTKSLYKNLPFGKRVVDTLDPEGAKNIQSTPEATGLVGKSGKFVGDVLSFAPAFEAGAAAIPAKIVGGALGVGAQSAGQASSEGASPKEAITKGAETAAGTYVGGKLLEGAGNVIASIPKAASDASARLYDWMVKLPTKAFNYGKNPMETFTKEKVTGNSITELAENFKDRLDQRTNELNDAIEGSDKKIDLSKTVDAHTESAANKLSGSLKDRTTDIKALDTMKENLTKQYGDLGKISVQDAIKLKRQLADDYPFTRENSTDIVANAAHKIYHDINGAVEEAHPEIADLNQRVSGLIDISKAAQNRMAIEARQNPIGLIQTMLGMGVAGAAGGAVHGVEGAGAGVMAALATKAATSPAVLSRVAKALANLSEIDKINLYNAAPWFMDIAQKAHDFASQKSSQLGFTGRAGSPIISNGGLKEAELLGGQPKGLPAPAEPVAPRTTPKYPQKDPTFNEYGQPLNHPVIQLPGATKKTMVDLSTTPRTEPSTGMIKSNPRAQVNMAKGGGVDDVAQALQQKVYSARSMQEFVQSQKPASAMQRRYLQDFYRNNKPGFKKGK